MGKQNGQGWQDAVNDALEPLRTIAALCDEVSASGKRSPSHPEEFFERTAAAVDRVLRDVEALMAREGGAL